MTRLWPVRPVTVALVVLAAVAAGGCATQPPGSEASGVALNCAEPVGEVATLICAEPQLAGLNARLADAYRQALTQPDRDGLQTAQRGWTAHRDDCAQAPDVHRCLAEAYQTRLVELMISDAATVPPKVAVFEDCRGTDEPLVAQFYNDFDPPAAVLAWNGGSEIVFVQRSGSGARYGRQGIQYWEHQGEAAVDFYGNEFICATH